MSSEDQSQTNAMLGVNRYGTELTQDELAENLHRTRVGGLWKEIGKLQFEFLRERGLEPHHRLVDVGCGCLRGGIHFIPFLEPGHYYGLDISASLIVAAELELGKAKLGDRAPNLIVDDSFDVSRFGVEFDFAISISLFTHLPMNSIVRCLAAVAARLDGEGCYYATFFLADHDNPFEPIRQDPGDVLRYYDRDPFHYSLPDIRWMAAKAGLVAEPVTGWKHPRGQRMLELRHAPKLERMSAGC